MECRFRGRVVQIVPRRLLEPQRVQSFFYYELRSANGNRLLPTTIEEWVEADDEFYGTIISVQPLDLGDLGVTELSDAEAADLMQRMQDAEAMGV